MSPRTMNATAKNYRKFRADGRSAAHALRAARILDRWEAAGDAVRLKAEPEEENYFDVYGKPDTKEESDEIERLIETLGCYCIVGDYLDPISGKWDHGASVGMCIEKAPLDPFTSPYVVDVMAETLDELEKASSPEARIAAASKLVKRAAELLP